MSDFDKILESANIKTIIHTDPELKKKIENGSKFKYVVNGFSKNWTNIQVHIQDEGEKWIHKTIKK